MNPAQLLNPKAFAKENAKKKKAPNYGEFTTVMQYHMSSREGALCCHLITRIAHVTACDYPSTI